MLHLKHLLTDSELRQARDLLGDSAAWVDGSRSAGAQAVSVKHNQQLAQDSAACRPLQALVTEALQRDPLFVSWALPRRLLNPLFNRYTAPGEHYGRHTDNAILHSQARGEWVRSDLSCTVFLCDPQDYDGGELRIEHGLGQTSCFKLAAGDAIVYSASHVHEVTPVTRGVRLASFLWIESMVRSNEQRRLLFDLDMNLLKLRQQGAAPEVTLALTGTYHNLLRMWAST